MAEIKSKLDLAELFKELEFGHFLNLSDSFDWDSLFETLFRGSSEIVRPIASYPSNERYFVIAERLSKMLETHDGDTHE